VKAGRRELPRIVQHERDTLVQSERERQTDTKRYKKENVRPPIDTRGDTENAPGEPDVRGLPDREPGLGVGVERLVVVFRVFRDPPESRGARVVRAIDHDGQLE
jgi:hypothetical protein